MAVSCEPADLAEAAACFTCLDPAQKEAIKLYLLAVIAGGSTDPATLASEAACFICLDDTQKKAINTYLLCQAANGGTAPTECEALSGANSPEGAVTPDFEGQLYHETGDDTYWRSTGLTDADWVEISGGSQLIETVPAGEGEQFGIFAFGDLPGITEFTWNGEITQSGFDFQFMFDLTTLSFPNLTSVGPDGIQGAYLSASGCTGLTSISAPLLEHTEGEFTIVNCDALTTISLPNYVGNRLDCTGNAVLTTVSIPSFVPPNGTPIKFQTNALNAASVNHILARAVANAGYVTGTITLNGGTNAAPTGQGIVDKATLIGRGCTVTTT